MGNSIYIAIPLFGLLAVIQSAILPRLPFLGVTPQLLLVVALVWALIRGPYEGLIWAFIAGIWVDIFSITPLGLTSLVYMAAVGVALLLQRVLPPRPLLVAVLAAGAATLVYLLLYFVGLRLFGLGPTFNQLLPLLPMVVLHALLVVPVYWLMQLALRPFRPRQVQL